MSETIVEIRRSMSFDEQREHFIERLLERYEMTITNKEYDDLCASHGVFHGVFAKQSTKTIGWVLIKGVKVWVLRDGRASRLSTCYPPDIEYSVTSMIRSCFSGMARSLAIQIYRIYLEEHLSISEKQFESVKEAALYFFSKTKFAPLHIDRYKHKALNTAKVCVMIGRILSGTSEYVEICLKKKDNDSN